MTLTSVHKETIYTYLEEINDPEVPALSIIDLGIVRDVVIHKDELEVIITSTYTGCPALDMIAAQIKVMLSTLGYKKVKVTHTLSPPWTTDWMSEEGKRKLEAYGIAPPDKKFMIPKDGVGCPLCHSHNTKLISEFGSTACKALYQCRDCREPFDYFKCH
jgi:ring-1,2-phenylacetyl-CoA epoxidase subunit PaaD